METIRNYLDTMFANLPNTPAVIRAKNELWQMMEDKYNEMITDGRTENEAVGTIISEFGNLSELAEALGLEKEVNGYTDETSENSADTENAASEEKKAAGSAEADENARIIRKAEAEDLIRERSDSSMRVSLGIAICILSILGPVFGSVFFSDGMQFIGVIIMVIIAGIGAAVIVFGANSEEMWKELRKEKCTLSMDSTKYVAGERSSYSRNHTLFLTLGIMLCAICWVPSFIFSEVLPKYEDASTGVLFVAVAIGVMLIVYTAMRMNGYDALLGLNGKGTLKAAYEPEDNKEVKYIHPVAEFFMSVYWPTVTCLYLILSFTTFKWGITWVIWPITGILHRPLRRALTVKVDTENNI